MVNLVLTLKLFMSHVFCTIISVKYNKILSKKEATFHHSFLQLHLPGEEGHGVTERDGGIGGSGSDAIIPLTARSIRLERVVQALTSSQEELRRLDL